jgi:DNA-binding response OmpR family regulator
VTAPLTILLVEDEPLILLDLEFAVEDSGHQFVSAGCVAQALGYLNDCAIDLAILDVNLGRGTTCVPVAEELRRRGIAYVLHSGDLDRRNETIRKLGATVIAKPASAEQVVAGALAERARLRADRGVSGTPLDR